MAAVLAAEVLVAAVLVHDGESRPGRIFSEGEVGNLVVDLPIRNPERRGGFTVLFDGGCPLCRRSVEILKVRDREGALEFLPAQDPAVKEAFPWLSREALAASIHLVGPNGRTWEGVGAVEELARVLPGYRWLRFAFALPFARVLAGSTYRWIAKNRYKIRCGAHCSLRGGPPQDPPVFRT